MKKTLTITSNTNARVKRVVKLRNGRQRRREGKFIAEGFREILRALEADLECLEFFYCSDILGKPDDAQVNNLIKRAMEFHGIASFSVDKNVFAKMTYRSEPEGVLAVLKTPQFNLDELGEAQKGDLFLAVCGIEKPGNLGAMARSASAAGCKALFAIDSVVDAFNPNSIRASTGAVFDLPIINIDREAALKYFVDSGIKIFPAFVYGQIEYTKADMQQGAALVIGSEDTGLDKWWFKAAMRSGGESIKIPMKNAVVDSLNASNSAAILLFEAVRQKM